MGDRKRVKSGPEAAGQHHLVTLHERLARSPLWLRCETIEQRIALSNLHRRHVLRYAPLVHSRNLTSSAIRRGASRHIRRQQGDQGL